MLLRDHKIFRLVWWVSNLLLTVSLVYTLTAAGWEYSVREYLNGFSDAVVPAAADPEQKVQYILDWMRDGPPRAIAANPDALARRDPEDTLNYQQLLTVCGTATNAFLNLARSSGLQVRRLLLLTPDRNTKHVVAEVLLDDRWVIVDPTYRMIMRDRKGRMLTRKDLQDPGLFAQATSRAQNYPKEYNYDEFAHVRIAKFPLQSLHLRGILDKVWPGWDEFADWSLLLERKSFATFAISFCITIILLVWRYTLGWYADTRLKISRVRLRQKAWRAGTAFFSTPEIK